MSRISASTVEAPAQQHGLWGVLRDYWQLIRPRIVGMVLFTLISTGLVARGPGFSWTALAHGVLGSTLVIVGAIALNARLDCVRDGKMRRTARRPLPAGRLTRRQVTWFGILATLLGLAYLLVQAGGWLVVLAGLSWLIYVWIYTPLKVFSAWQTPVGAAAGAMPVLLGSAAVGHPFHATALALFGMVYFWQFPHAMALAWLYRQDFAAADLRVATVVDPSGRSAAWMALLGAAALLPLTLLPTLLGMASWGYGVIGLAVGLSYLAPAILFFLHPDDRNARRLLVASLGYLPVVFGAILLAAL